MILLSTDPSKGLETLRDDIRALGERIWKTELFIVGDALGKAEEITDVCQRYQAATILLDESWNFPLKDYNGKRMKADGWIEVMGGRETNSGCVLSLPVDGTTDWFVFTGRVFWDEDAETHARGVIEAIRTRCGKGYYQNPLHRNMWVLIAEHIEEWVKSL